jgi:plasmid stabilization system protein ParE
MTNSLESIIAFLEETNDPRVAYFSYTTDEAGENGAISANKEGLRLYALELLKKSLEIESMPEQSSLVLCPREWMVSETGYHLISCVRPQYHSRETILRILEPARHWMSHSRFDV